MENGLLRVKFLVKELGEGNLILVKILFLCVTANVSHASAFHPALQAPRRPPPPQQPRSPHPQRGAGEADFCAILATPGATLVTDHPGADGPCVAAVYPTLLLADIKLKNAQRPKFFSLEPVFGTPGHS